MAKQELHPVYGVPIRKFEPGQLFPIMNDTLEKMGVTFSIKPNGVGALPNYIVRGKTISFKQMVAKCDEWRIKHGLEPINPNHHDQSIPLVRRRKRPNGKH